MVLQIEEKVTVEPEQRTMAACFGMAAELAKALALAFEEVKKIAKKHSATIFMVTQATST